MASESPSPSKARQQRNWPRSSRGLNGMPRDRFVRDILSHQADPALTDDLAALADETTGRLAMAITRGLADTSIFIAPRIWTAAAGGVDSPNSWPSPSLPSANSGQACWPRAPPRPASDACPHWLQHWHWNQSL